jgi:hypothetical protein
MNTATTTTTTTTTDTTDTTTPLLPLPPGTPFTHYYRLSEDKIRKQCLRESAEQQAETNVDPRSICLPIGFATVVDALGELTPCSEESAKKCQAFLEHRLVPRHKIPKVGMRADGKFAIRAAAAREAKLMNIEIILLQDESKVKELEAQTRSTAVKKWKESLEFGSTIAQEMISKAKGDVGRYHDDMHKYYKRTMCACAKKKKCYGLLCICTCYFCSHDRPHAIAGARCECSSTHRQKKRWEGSVKKDIDPINNASKKTSAYRTRPEKICQCLKRKQCAVHGCDCFCGYCLREKALFVQRNERKNQEYCPCSNVQICRDSRTCMCRCYKCSCEKNLMGICPFRPPQVF